ncbi:hypothetical protein [Erythrobacter donghaensis]|nr:hypothetical protein [Erythrobacter donghaensis]
MTNVTITTATSADAAALKQLLEAAYRGDSARQGWNQIVLKNSSLQSG